ncbi:DNA cytosine methyltransferase [Actinopolymorpha alba]|uniref:DNA cytosine methyltransferase n=1 Tax=Actinopolymorpha alba TaxID=533267 RepID=UPI000373BD17|nr:DNA cytosine methyltransferase [Actinopolymorpha alba]
MSLTFTDIFCGAGGSSIGLASAGFELKLAANHWARAIETHSANFTDAEHLCADVNNYDMRRLPTTDVLWASPICTEVSPAGGRRRKGQAHKRTKPAPGQIDLLEFGPISQAGYERTRATFHDVIRATEVHRYKAILVENVVEVASEWELFDWWVNGMLLLGYEVQFVSVSAAHIGGGTIPYAPQWRDRLYLVFTRKGIPLPDVDPRPVAWCSSCDEDVEAFQSWKKPGRRIGKYRAQYDYRCPSHRRQTVEPYVLPAATAIDWSDLGTRIGDRKRPLAAATMRRIQVGLDMFARASVVAVNHDDFRAYPAESAPLATRTGKIGDALAIPPMVVPSGGTWNEDARTVDEPFRTRTANPKGMEALFCPPYVVELRNNCNARGVDEPLTTIAAEGNHHALVNPFLVKNHSGFLPPERAIVATDQPMGTVTTGRHHSLVYPPFLVKNYGGNCAPKDTIVPAGRPMGTVTARDHHALVIPYRRAAKPYRAVEAPLSTVATVEQHGVLDPAVNIDDCHFRMLQPREHLRAQTFPDTYIVHGNKGEQTMQAGNAVATNVAQWLGTALAAALGGGAAAR